MIDDHRYSTRRTVVYRHPNPVKPLLAYGQHGPERTVGVVTGVHLIDEPEEHWEYTIRNLFSQEAARVTEADIYFGMLRHRSKMWEKDLPQGLAPEDLRRDLSKVLNRYALLHYLNTTIRDLIHREESEEYAKRQGRNLPLESGDYIRIRGDIREENEPFHNHYAKIVRVMEPDVAALTLSSGEQYAVVQRYRVQLEDGTEAEIYDPEVKLYYTARSRTTILNWRAATFLAESFGDHPPYSVEYSFLEDHIFTRKELEELTTHELMQILASLLYVKGRMGLRDYEKKEEHLEDLSREYLVDTILSTSRFNMHKNRNLTEDEIRQKHKEVRHLKKLLRDVQQS